MELTVFKNQYGYSTLAKNGEDKMYVSVQFKKGNEPSTDRVRLKIDKGFISLYKNRVGIAFPKIVIMEYTIEGEQEYQNSFPSDDFVPQFDDSDLPF